MQLQFGSISEMHYALTMTHQVCESRVEVLGCLMLELLHKEYTMLPALVSDQAYVLLRL